MAHLALGHALRGLLDEDVLVIGSGFSFHNMRAFQRRGQPAVDAANDAFQDWLIETCTGPLDEVERERRLAAWAQAPGARYCHPREEHLLPLHICAGLGRQAGGGGVRLLHSGETGDWAAVVSGAAMAT